MLLSKILIITCLTHIQALIAQNTHTHTQTSGQHFSEDLINQIPLMPFRAVLPSSNNRKDEEKKQNFEIIFMLNYNLNTE